MTEAQLADPFGLVGTTLDGQYRADEVVGEGGFGVVYRGWHSSLEQPIAIKALKVMSADNPAVQDALFAKFKDEAKLLYTLSQASLHIVRSMDFGAVTTAAGVWAPYMVLEWLQGMSLAADLAERRRRGMRGRSLDEALALLEPAAEGLGIAHQRRVAHRDVKPANFFLLEGNSGPRVKVLDFGIAKIIRDGDGPGTRSPFTSFTWLYAAPEQLDPRVGQSGLATDVYSFALLLTELLTDRVPTDAQDVVTLLKAATDTTLRPTPRRRGATVPDGIEVACRRALAVDPKARFANIGELWAALVEGRRTSLPQSLSSRDPRDPRESATPATAPSPGMGSAAPSAMAFASTLPVGRSPSHAELSVAALSPPAHLPPPGAHSLPAYSASPHSPYAPPGPYAPYDPNAPSAVALSPPAHLPPPGTTGMGYPPSRPFAPKGPSSIPIVLAVIGVVIGLMFVATCSAVHAACG